MIGRHRIQKPGQQKPSRKQKAKNIKRSITRNQFHALVKKSAQPLKRSR